MRKATVFALPPGLMLPDASRLSPDTVVNFRVPATCAEMDVRVANDGLIDGAELRGMLPDVHYSFCPAGNGTNEWDAFPPTAEVE